jgi:hypothetical protein
MNGISVRPKGGVVTGFFVLTLFMLAYIAAIGFGTVWLRHEISVLADVNKAIEGEIAILQRRLDEATAEVAFAQSPEQLLKQNIALGVNLVRPREEQIIRTSDEVERMLAAKRFNLLYSARDGPPARPGAEEAN